MTRPDGGAVADPRPQTDPADTRVSRPALVVGGAVVAVVLVLVVVVALTRGSSDTDPVAATSASEQTESTSTDDPPTSAPTDTDTTDVPDVRSVDPAPEADAADDAGIAALVPDARGDSVGVVTAAAFDDQAGLWQLTVTTGAGDVVVRQHRDKAEALVATYTPGSRSGDDVDLARWGLGTWATATSADGALISRDLPHGGALISGPDLDTVLLVAKTLLAHENLRGGEGD